MKVQYMDAIRKVITALIFAFGVSSAHAASMDFTFDIVWSDSTTSTVFLTLDGYTGTDLETFSPGDSAPVLSNLEVNAYGQAFEMVDDNGYPLKPVVQLLDGALAEVDFHLNNENGNSLAALLSTSDNSVGYNPYGSSVIASGVIDENSFIPVVTNDEDSDGIEDDVDNCPSAPNPEQINTDGADDGGDACDDDDDNDLICDENMDIEGVCIAGPAGGDNCRSISNNNQLDTNEDGCGDLCTIAGCGGAGCIN
jgi:hypothetical protein